MREEEEEGEMRSGVQQGGLGSSLEAVEIHGAGGRRWIPNAILHDIVQLPDLNTSHPISI